jgi:hypothetical protein
LLALVSHQPDWQLLVVMLQAPPARVLGMNPRNDPLKQKFMPLRYVQLKPRGQFDPAAQGWLQKFCAMPPLPITPRHIPLWHWTSMLQVESPSGRLPATQWPEVALQTCGAVHEPPAALQRGMQVPDTQILLGSPHWESSVQAAQRPVVVLQAGVAPEQVIPPACPHPRTQAELTQTWVGGPHSGSALQPPEASGQTPESGTRTPVSFAGAPSGGV